MSVELVNLSYKQVGLTASEHSILNVLSHRANDKSHECWPSAKSLSESTSLDIKTVYKCLASLCEKERISKTGRMVGRTKRTPVYKINTPKNGSVQNLNTPTSPVNTPKNGSFKYTQNWVLERSFIKGKGKGVFSLLKHENQEQAQILHHLINSEQEPNYDEWLVVGPLVRDYMATQKLANKD